jgi:lipoprotein NlpD
VAATTAPATSAVASPAPATTVVLPGAENAGKPGYYTVKPGDTMVRIGLEHGQSWRDIARWNNLENPNVIEVGQVLRVVPPEAAAGVASRPVNGSATEVRPVAPTAAAGVSSGAASAPATPAVAAMPSTAGGATPQPVGPSPVAAAPAIPAPAAPAPAAPPAAPRDPDEDIAWAWPAEGPVAGAFNESRSKGLAILGQAGAPVLAAADGRVVYAGAGLRGYGNLVIVKHNNTYLSAYAHNQTLLVKEDQVVRRGQKIAEMGSSDADRVQLHFEIRRQGRPVDPAKLLPPR